MFRPQGACILNDASQARGATILDSAVDRDLVLTTAMGQQLVLGAGGSPKPPELWGGGWVHGADMHRSQALNQNRQPLRMLDISAWNNEPPGTMWMEDEACPCSDVTYQDLVHPSSAKYIGGHVHGYRIVCPVCKWYGHVDADKDYAIPHHGAKLAVPCSGLYAIVRSELFAYPFLARFEPPDMTPTQWRVYNGWTGKYVCNVNGAEDPDQDHAFGFPDEATAVAFVRAQTGGATALAKALAASPKPVDHPYCSSSACGYEHHSPGATACWKCSSPLSTTRGWCYVWPCNVQGQSVGKGLTF
jgi:hypothetical protein